jgi:hypothetical protein
MSFLAACSIGVALGLLLVWLASRAAITVCLANVDDGHLKIVKGGLAPRVLADLRDIALRPRVSSGTIRIVRAKDRARVEIAGEFTDAQRQQIRNVVGTVPLAKLTNAPRKK